jgi:carbon storage regulator
MLLLTRKIGETICIYPENQPSNEDSLITIKIHSIYGNCVKLGINAPDEIAVHRKEIYERILKANIPLNANQVIRR